jgi:hypothetical protein
MVAEGTGLAGVWPEWMQMLRVRGSNVRFQILWRSSIGREEKVERGEGWEKGVELPRVNFLDRRVLGCCLEFNGTVHRGEIFGVAK